MKKTIALAFVALCFVATAFGQTLIPANNAWKNIVDMATLRNRTPAIVPQHYRTLAADDAQLKTLLAAAPMENLATMYTTSEGVRIALPMPDGTDEVFRVFASPVMAPELAARYPEIQTYVAISLRDPSRNGRLDYSTYLGFHALISTREGEVFIDPYARFNTAEYISYYKHDFVHAEKMHCEHDGSKQLSASGKGLGNTTEDNARKATWEAKKHDAGNAARSPTDFTCAPTLRTYRLAVSTTGEYSAFFGGTKPTVLAAVVTSVNRVTHVYEKELDVRMILIPKEDTLICLNATTDGFTNNDGGTLLGENQQRIDSVIGIANYDIGHVFSTGGGGVAYYGCVCNNTTKARGVTGSSAPVGDPFDIDYVAHEMGHEFGGSHPFNSIAGACNGNRVGAVAYEPGSGVTVMAYAGICGADDLAPHSIDKFHTGNFDEMLTYIQTGDGDACPVHTASGNHEPVVTVPTGGFYIPRSTPFTLTGSATDPDNDPLTYSWEELDLGPAGAPDSPTADAPIFRSFDPVLEPTRTFPKESDLLNGVHTIGELLPTYTRNLNFRLTARDNRAACGGVSYSGLMFHVAGTAGPLVVTYPDTTTWGVGSAQTITWNVAGTNATPVNCTLVDILLSTDGGKTFPHILATAVPNNGAYTLSGVPNLPTDSARVKVRANGNIFFALSKPNYKIKAFAPDFILTNTAPLQTVCGTGSAVYSVVVNAFSGFNTPVHLSLSPSASGIVGVLSDTVITPIGNATVTLTVPNGTPIGTYVFNLTGVAGTKTHTIALTVKIDNPTVQVFSALTPPDLQTAVVPQPSFAWQASTAGTYTLQVATDSLFTNIIDTETANITTASASVHLQNDTRYFWRVSVVTPCGVRYSNPTRFRTGFEQCSQYAATGLPIVIDSVGAPTITSVINIPDNVTITDVNVIGLRGTHTYINDLSFELASPDGTSIVLIPQSCGGQNNFHLSLDDQAAAAPLPCPYNNSQTYRPYEPLATFNGKSSQGAWTLTIADHANNDGGALTGWALQVCTVSLHPISTENTPFATADLKLYPNPTRGIAYLAARNLPAATTIQVYSIQGQQMYSLKATNEGEQVIALPTQGFAAGVYVVQLTNGDAVQTLKLVVE